MSGVVPMKFGKWMLIAMLGYAAFDAVFVVLAAIALRLAMRDLWMPFVLFLCSGLIGVSLVYWALRDRPKSLAIRFALAIFFYLVLFIPALAFSAGKLQIVAWPLVRDFAPWIFPGAAACSVLVYLRARRQVKNTQFRS